LELQTLKKFYSENPNASLSLSLSDLLLSSFLEFTLELQTLKKIPSKKSTPSVSSLALSLSHRPPALQFFGIHIGAPNPKKNPI